MLAERAVLALLLSLGITIVGTGTRARAAEVESPVDWPAFMARHDMHFDKLPRNWTEAPHFGNAAINSMLHQDDNTIKLQVFRNDVHDHRDDTWGWPGYSRARFRIGHFSLEPVGKLTGCEWRKDLWNAEMTGTITTDRGEINIRHFTHAIDMARRAARHARTSAQVVLAMLDGFGRIPCASPPPPSGACKKVHGLHRRYFPKQVTAPSLRLM